MKSWSGRIYGAIIGLFLPIPMGLFIGFFLGWLLFDRPRNLQLSQNFQTHTQTDNRALVMSTFALMGYVARGAGAIQREQIERAERIMQIMNLDSVTRQSAQAAFNRGKGADFDPREEIAALRAQMSIPLELISYLLEIQVQIALADGVLTDEESRRLHNVAAGFGVSAAEMDRLINLRYAEARFRRGFGGGASGSYTGSGSGSYERDYSQDEDYSDSAYEEAQPQQLAQAYALLGLKESATFEEVSKAHKRLMLKYHPDRLASQGLPPEMVKMYSDKAKDIQAAFDLIKKART
ncbi:MAG: co-chaperone DjlA [Succinivibrio sp.]|nr:co-chaperone DjlA [Succinivibrio sp.]